MQGRKEKVAGFVAREEPARAVAPVRGRSEADEKDSSVEIAKGG